MGTGRSGAALGRMGTSGGGWEQGEPEQSIWPMAPSWATRMVGGEGCGPPPSGAAEVGMGWRGLASLRADAEGTTWSGRWLRAGDQETGGGRLVKNRGILVFSCDPSPLN